ncbi:MAG TPA: BamA/TamA family outer membrane protein [Thermoanaerobaculaceae bacterium]|nr:BamA/TamA family outer membrane protein [Thermoanaerobaculaceae bacterium]
MAVPLLTAGHAARRGLAAAALALAAAAPPARADAPLVWKPVPVARVVVDAPGATDLAELKRAFGIREGGALSRAEIRAGVQAVMATGAVEDVRVEVAIDDAGAAIVVHVASASRVREVVVSGLPRRERKRVIAALALRRGEPLHVEAFETALDNARHGLVEDGFPRARLDPDLSFTSVPAEVAVAIRGELGTPLLLAAAAAPGSALAGEELLKSCGLKPGQRLTSASLESARKRLATRLRRDGYWEAEVDSPVVSEDARGATLTFGVVRGPAFTLALEGVKRTRSFEEDALPFVRGEEAFNESGLDLVEDRVRATLQQQGRLLVEAKAEVSGAGDARVLHLKVKPGPMTPIVAVRFPGAVSVPAKELRERVGARVGHYWRWGGEPVDDESLAADAASLLGTLRTAGFADAKVGTPRVLAEGGGVAVEFPVEEGQRRTVAHLDTPGVPDKVKPPKLPLAPGKPWSQTAEEQARSALEAAIQEAGFPDATVAAAHTCDAEGACDVTLRAEPGSPAVLGRVVAAGLFATRRGVVDKVAGLKPGDIGGPAARLAAQRRLLALGIFQRADLRPIPDQDSGPRRGLLLDLDEGPSQAVSFGLGYDTEQKTRVSLTWTELNLFGTARSLSFLGQLSSQQQRFEIDYREPARLGVLGFPTWLSVYRTEAHFTTYDLLERGTWVEFGDRLRRPFRAVLRYEYQIVEPTAPPEILSQLEREQQHLAISSISPTIEWDTRDDVFSPHRGLYASLQYQTAFKLFSADSSFDKVLASFSVFAPAQGGVLAVMVRGGAIEPRGRVAGMTDNLQLPIAVRFFGGGRISNRAFGTDELGIPGQTLECQQPTTTTATGCSVVPTGGAGELLTTLEYRFHVFGPVGGDVFLDGGNIWQAWRQIAAGDLRWGAGLGIRVETPVGPLRLEYGWKFDRLLIGTPPNAVREAPGELFLSFGNPF